MVLRERLRLCAAALLYYLGIIQLVLWWKQRSNSAQRQLLILNYHRAEGNLPAQLRYLQRHYRVLHLDDALEMLYAPASVTPHRGDRRLPVAITFDDGYQDNYTQAWPLAQALRIPITIFLIPGYIESGQFFWWLAGKKIARSVAGKETWLDNQRFDLQDERGRKVLATYIDTKLRYASSVALRERLLADIQQHLGVVLPTRSQADSIEEKNGTLPLIWDQVHEMAESGWVSYGAHTMHHPLLAHLSEPDEVLSEVEKSRHILEGQLGHEVRTFAYPIGKNQHFGIQGQNAARVAGFRWAVTTIEEINTPATDPFLLGRLPGDTRQHWLLLAAELAGCLGIVSKFKKRYRQKHRSVDVSSSSAR